MAEAHRARLRDAARIRTIFAFRQRHLPEFQELFVWRVQLARVVGLGTVAGREPTQGPGAGRPGPKWRMPLHYEKHETGGSWLPGFHKAQVYGREAGDPRKQD